MRSQPWKGKSNPRCDARPILEPGGKTACHVGATATQWVIVLMVLAVLMSGGCAQVSVERPSPLAKFSATAKSMFQRDRPAKTKTTPSSHDTESADQELGRLGTRPSPSVGSGDPLTGPSQLGGLASPDSNRRTSAAVSFRDEQSAYEQGRHDAMQAAFQQPVDYIQTNPQTNPPANYIPQHPSQTYHPGQQPTLPQPTPWEPTPWEPSPSQAMTADQYHPPAHSFPMVPMNETSIQPQPMGTNYLAGGMNLVGTGLRLDRKTANEIAHDLLAENESLRQQLSAAQARAEQLSQTIEEQQSTLTGTQELLSKSNRLAVLLREKIASQNVKLQDLEKEKWTIERNADKALKEIETELDAVLMDTISKGK